MDNRRRYIGEENEISSTSRRKKSASAVLKSIKVKRVVSMVMCIIFLVFGVGMIYIYKTLDSLTFMNASDATNPPTGETEDETTGTVDDSNLMDGVATFSDGQLLDDPMVLNIALFGDDAMDENAGGFGRSDTIILLSIDNRHQKIKMTSFQRDTFVYIPGHSANKINSSYSSGGPSLTIKTIEANFGILIDRYAVVGFSSFRNIIDVLGGVDIELTQEEIDYINYQRVHRGEQNMYPELLDEPGMVHLCGGQALWYARNRGWDYDWSEFKTSGDDWDRTSRQRNLLSVVASSMKDANIAQIVQIVSEIGPLVTTNLKKNEITILAANALKYLNYEIVNTTVPFSDCWRYSWSSDGQSIIEITDWDKQRNDLAEYIYEEMVGTPTSE